MLYSISIPGESKLIFNIQFILDMENLYLCIIIIICVLS